MYLALWLIRRWRLPATPAFILPDAVILKRFLAPAFVFSFGISRRSGDAPSSWRDCEPPWHALVARRFRRAWLIRERPRECKEMRCGQVLPHRGSCREATEGVSTQKVG